MNKTKPFCISKESVKSAWERVKANKGTHGIDKESIEDFEINLKDNLYKLWNRMSSGSYFPPPVRGVAIPKGDGKKRMLGIPTVSDRIAQAVVKSALESIVEQKFHKDSYGYRPGKSALEAVGVARERCWQEDWCIDLDIKGFFDNLDHELMMKAVRYHTKEKWIHLYVERWLKAPLQIEEGEVIERKNGSPQGSVISPLLANIFLHHGFDEWMKKTYPAIRFERYADDIITHCRTEKEAERVLEAIKERLRECRLEINPEKTKIVYCKDSNRRERYEKESFDFLGYTFRPRLSINKRGNTFINFTPAISKEAGKGIKKEIKSWKIHLRSGQSLSELAKLVNRQVQGWVNYYGRYYKSAMYPILGIIERKLISWVKKKYKRLKGYRKAIKWLRRMRESEPRLFVHWKLGL